jgi:hypothetical protein
MYPPSTIQIRGCIGHELPVGGCDVRILKVFRLQRRFSYSYNWKGDPNATLSGQDIPQLPAGEAPPPDAALQSPPEPPLAVAQYDPATGTYIGPDGNVYGQTDLARPTTQQTWQSMLVPPTGN